MNKWYDIKLAFNCEEGEYDFWLNGKLVKEAVELDIETPALERMVFRTGSWRSDVRQFLINGQPGGPGMDSEVLPASGQKVPASIFWIDNVKTMGQ